MLENMAQDRDSSIEDTKYCGQMLISLAPCNAKALDELIDEVNL